MPVTADLRGKRALVTGATGTLGGELARALLDRGASVWLAARNPAKAARLEAALRTEYPAGDFAAVPLDLSALASVDALCERLQGQPLDLLVNNAGVYRQPRATTADGVERTFQINGLAPVYLTLRLLPQLLQSGGRVVTMTSFAAFYTRFDAADPQALQTRNLTEVYARAKLAEALCMAHIDRRADVRAAGARSVLTHPGISTTGLFSQENGAFKARTLRFIVPIMRRLFMSPAQAIRGPVEACVAALPPDALVQPRGLLHAWGKPTVSPLPRAWRDEAACAAALERVLAQLPPDFIEKIKEPYQ